MLFRTRRQDECSRLKEGARRRVRKSRQKEAAGVADAGLMEIEWSQRGVWEFAGIVKADGVGVGVPVRTRVEGRSEPRRGEEEDLWVQRRHTSVRRSEERRQRGVWASEFMQPRPGAGENGVEVVPP